jgi:hypothetical protein
MYAQSQAGYFSLQAVYLSLYLDRITLKSAFISFNLKDLFIITLPQGLPQWKIS